MSRVPRLCSAAVVLLVPLAAGCPATYRAETVLHDDGSVERAIYQPSGATPAAVKQPQLWKQTTFAPGPDQLEKQGITGPITHLPIRSGGGDQSYFAAWGTFQSVQDLPEHVLLGGDDRSNLPPHKLARESTRNDYVFVIEHRWRETLTDSVTLADMRRAREEAANLLINVFADAFAEAWGQEYDATDLVRWLRGEGKGWLAELTDYLYVDRAAHKAPGSEKALFDGLADVCARHGLIFKKDGKLLDDEAAGKALDEFIVDRLCRGVRNKTTGQAVTRETAAGWWRDVKHEDAPQGQASVFEAAANRVIDQKYGGQEAFQRRLDDLTGRALGLYNDHADQFDYTLTVPGEVVETNGQLLAKDRVRWQFVAADAYPLGYDMTCRSLVPQPEAQKALLPGQPLDTRESLLRLVSLLDGRELLAEALRECRKQKAMTPLYEYRENLPPGRAKAGDAEAVAALLKLLRLPPQAPSGSDGAAR